MIKKIQLTDFKNSVNCFFSLQTCTKSIAYMYQKNYKSARALVYKGFSKFVGLDENWTKRIILPKPFVLEIASNQ